MAAMLQLMTAFCLGLCSAGTPPDATALANVRSFADWADECRKDSQSVACRAGNDLMTSAMQAQPLAETLTVANATSSSRRLRGNSSHNETAEFGRRLPAHHDAPPGAGYWSFSFSVIKVDSACYRENSYHQMPYYEFAYESKHWWEFVFKDCGSFGHIVPVSLEIHCAMNVIKTGRFFAPEYTVDGSNHWVAPVEYYPLGNRHFENSVCTVHCDYAPEFVYPTSFRCEALGSWPGL